MAILQDIHKVEKFCSREWSLLWRQQRL